MKKFALMLAVAMPVLAMTSCGDDEVTDVTLDQNTMSVNYQAEGQLKASENGGTWASANEFVATVDNKGKVQGVHCGVTTITYSKDGSSASCQVTVTPTNTNFTLPILTWGATKATVKSNISNLYLVTEDATTLSYGQDNQGSLPRYDYNFTNDALDASGLYMTKAQSAGFADFIKQYYQKYAEKEGEFELIDGLNMTTATTELSYGYDTNLQEVYAEFVPISHTKAANDMARKNLRAIERKIANK